MTPRLFYGALKLYFFMCHPEKMNYAVNIPMAKHALLSMT